MIIVKVPAPLFGEQAVEHLSADRAEVGKSGALHLHAAPDDAGHRAVVAEYAPGRWGSWRAVSEEESRLVERVRALQAEVDQLHAEAIDAANDAEESDAADEDGHPEPDPDGESTTITASGGWCAPPVAEPGPRGGVRFGEVSQEQLEENLLRELRRDRTGGEVGAEYLAGADDRLLWLLNAAGREWGPMGVALAAAHMSDPRAVRKALKAATR